MPPFLIALCGIAVLAITFLILSIPLGWAWSGVVVAVAGIAAWCGWQRKAIREWRARSRKRRNERRAAAALAEKATAQPASTAPAAVETAAAPAPSVEQTAEAIQSAPETATRPAPLPRDSSPAAESPADDPLTEGLADPLRPFLLTAMSRSEWIRNDLEAVASEMRVNIGEALAEIDRWSRHRFGEPVLVPDGSLIRVQLPLL